MKNPTLLLLKASHAVMLHLGHTHKQGGREEGRERERERERERWKHCVLVLLHYYII